MVFDLINKNAINFRSFIIFLLTVTSFYVIFNQNSPLLQETAAVGTWNGQDTLHVPMSWCAVNGSQAVSNPNVPQSPDSPTPTDSTTDAILWRRHERPTDNIFINQAGMTFRSAINSIGGINLHFPTFNDPDTTLGVRGDVMDLRVSNTEFNQLLNLCETEWTQRTQNGTGVLAVPVINVNLFHNSTGGYIGSAIGWGGCARSSTTGLCANPYDALVGVADNHYLFTSVPDRRLPGTNLIYVPTDPFDQLVGHELGHALGLSGHRTDTNRALMYPSQQDTDGNGRTDNIELNNIEVSTIRGSALNVPGLERDPTNQIIRGNIVAASRADNILENKTLPPYLDFSSAKVTRDPSKITFSERLFGLIPDQAQNLQYWTLVDTDNDPVTGANQQLLTNIGVPNTNFNGTDLVIVAEVNNRKITGEVWQYRQGNLISLPSGAFSFDILTMTMEPLYAPIAPMNENSNVGISDTIPDATPQVRIHDIISATINAEVIQIPLGKTFSLQAISVDKGSTLKGAPGTPPIADKLPDIPEKAGTTLTLEYRQFPHCFPLNDVVAGMTVKIKLEGLLPNANIHGLLGPTPVFNGTTDSTGGGIIDFPIPSGTKGGLHLITIGVDDTALTADCVINVREG
jgi:hypothetical protein